MKTFAVFLVIIAVALAGSIRSMRPLRPFPYSTHVLTAPSARKVVSRSANPSSNEVQLVNEIPHNNIGLDSYNYAYELSDGSTRNEQAQIEVRSVEDAILRVQGSYSWVNPADGQTYTITYIADENGFQPQGAHLPVAPQV